MISGILIGMAILMIMLNSTLVGMSVDERRELVVFGLMSLFWVIVLITSIVKMCG